VRREAANHVTIDCWCRAGAGGLDSPRGALGGGGGLPVVSTPRQRRPSAALSVAPSLALAALGESQAPLPTTTTTTTTSSTEDRARVMPLLDPSRVGATPSTAGGPPVMPKLNLAALSLSAAAADETSEPKQVLTLSSLSGLTSSNLARRYGGGSVLSARMSDASSLPGGSSPRGAEARCFFNCFELFSNCFELF
jgi:hypothetical protein